MQLPSFLGLPGWLWLLVVLIGAIVGVHAMRQAAARRTHRHEEERLAQQADATHEGAQTRHEGGP